MKFLLQPSHQVSELCSIFTKMLEIMDGIEYLKHFFIDVTLTEIIWVGLKFEIKPDYVGVLPCQVGYIYQNILSKLL